jgi:4-hydroxybenzoate polyprenyltransferase
MTTRLPLAVDLDGTLARSDSLVDALTATLLRNPSNVPAVLRAFLNGRLALKTAMLECDAYSPGAIPLHIEFLDYLKDQKAEGRSLHLVTASPQPVADAIARRVDLFDTASGSQNGINLKGEAKADHLAERFPDGFAYAGNDDSDLLVWKRAKSAITVATSASVMKSLTALGIPVEAEFPRKAASISTWLRMLRVHQWTKNALIFVPLVLGHEYTSATAVTTTVLAFLFMGLVASATYILNDLSDLDADRQHATKKNRPLAAADISVLAGVSSGLVLGSVGMTGAFLLDRWFALCLVGYVFLTVSYSLRLKAIALLDVFMLGSLFTLRVLMGVVLLRAAPSPWLLMFSLFFFLSLSIAKRHVEIVRAAERGVIGRIKGRGYLATDAPLTLSLGTAASSIAITLLILYVANDAYPANTYAHPAWLWAIAPLVFLWTTRIWLKSHRGRLDDDPITFALRDPPSIGLGVLVVVVLALATL